MSLERLIEIMKRLRDPVSGCEWDSVQTFATIAPYTIEEAYEVADAIARDDMDALADERYTDTDALALTRNTAAAVLAAVDTVASSPVLASVQAT